MIDRLTGILLLITTVFATLVEWHGGRPYALAAGAGTILFLILAAPYLRWSRRVFIIIALALAAAAMLTRPDWMAMIEAGMKSAVFIAGFFTALTCLRYASAASPAVESCGRFLAEQPPGRRYLALTMGGHLFGLVLGYGAISLLGSLAEANARREPDVVVRTHRIRRMLLAIQRGFASTLCWSPLAFASAVSTALVPGASWADAAAPCFVASLIMAGLGWALDTIFKPVLPNRPARAAPTGSWASLIPMLALLAILVASVGGLHAATGVRAVGVVMLVVPVIALIWLAMLNRHRTPPVPLASQASGYVRELASYRAEIVLLVMAGFIGTLGSQLLSPLIVAAGFDLAALPAWTILIGVLWLIPLTGLLGMNPILSVSLIAPLLPEAAEMGVTPTAIILALTSGWALGGASSPYTATTLLLGAIAKVSAWRVGVSWNGVYTLISGVALSAWVLIFAFG